MKKTRPFKSKSTPDFSVQWNDSSLEFESQIFLDDPEQTNDALLTEKMREPLILLETDTTCVAVTELAWTESTTISMVPDRPAFCMTSSSSPTTSVLYGYDDHLDHSAKTGNTLFLVPGKKITGRGSLGSFRTVMCSFDTDFAESIVGDLSALSDEQLLRAIDIQNALITSILFRLMKEAMHPGPMSKTVVEACGNALLVECAHWLQTGQEKESGRGKLTAKHHNIIDEYLNDINGKLPSVAELASACGFSERHFLKLFREEKKCSVSQYIKSIQIAKARTLLLETDVPLKEIAYRLGFSSPANFSSAFRAATGKTPGQVRKSK